MDKGFTTAVMVQVKSKPSELFALGSYQSYFDLYVYK